MTQRGVEGGQWMGRGEQRLGIERSDVMKPYAYMLVHIS